MFASLAGVKSQDISGLDDIESSSMRYDADMGLECLVLTNTSRRTSLFHPLKYLS
jgi:hypothetical protein